MIVLVQKWPFRDAHLFFKNALLGPPFLCFLGARFLGQVVKKGNSGHPQKKLADNWKVHFWIFLCFFLFVFGFLSLLLTAKKPVFPPKKGIFCLFECLPLFLLSLFWPVTCSIFLSLFFFVFLLVFFAFFGFLIYFFFIFLSSLLLFHEK